MKVTPQAERKWQPAAALAVVLCSVAAVVLAALGQRLVQQHRYVQRGVRIQPLPFPRPPTDNLYGVNASLEQYPSEEELRSALGAIHDAGIGWVRQHFPWADIEPHPGQYEWEPWDRVVQEVKGQGLELIAVLDTSPPWARAPVDQQNRLAPPQFVTTYALFVRAFAQRYGEEISCYEVWDEPNIYPQWGERPIDPAHYVRLLRTAAQELRRTDGDAIVLAGGLAPNTEAGGRNLSDVLFLRGMYRSGAEPYFDLLAAKPYGFWTGPEDRRVDPSVLNFSRLILLREEMVSHGDGGTPVWAVEFGWNALPETWQGGASPWGTDTPAKQAERTIAAIQRARQEWGWLGLLCWAQFQPVAPPDHPLWGFALVRPDSLPTALFGALRQGIAAPLSLARADQDGYLVQIAVLALVGLLLLAAALWLWPRSLWPSATARLAARYRAAAEWLQWLVLGLALLAYYVAPGDLLALALLACSGALICQRLDIGLFYLVLSVPFFLYPRSLFGKSFSAVETLALLCLAAWIYTQVRECAVGQGLRWARSEPRAVLVGFLRSLTSLDWAVLAFLALSALSLLVSQSHGVSLREFRVIVAEPVLFYLLIRGAHLTVRQRVRLVDALVLASAAVCLVGLAQYFLGGDVIVAEGVRRMRSVYASPNNLSLLLGRAVAFALAMAAAGRGWRRRAYAFVLAPLCLCLFLTYSRGGWLLAFPAAVLTIGSMRGRRATLWAVAVILLCVALLLPLVGTQRFASLLDTEQGTSFHRLKLWQAALAMIRDYPLTGVGLDNFLYRYPEYMLPEAWQEPNLSHPHNIVLDYWTRLGILGVLVLVWLVTAFFRLGLLMYRGLPEGNERAIILGAIAAMSSTLAHGLIDNSYFLVDLAFIFFLCLALVRAREADGRSAGLT